jgi:TonB-linked SusC/RagA family outer membrane protein
MRRKLKGFLSSFFALLIALSSMAQTKNVSGTVTDAKNEPVANATVTVRGTNRATQTNANGFYTIAAQKGEALVITAIGQKEFVITVGDGSVLNARMAAADGLLQEVEIVGTMDRRLNKREVSYSSQTVNGDEVKNSQRENLVNGLAGRVAGLTVNPTSGVAGASSQIVLRGFNSLSLSNQPLFVVDGVILDNSTLDENSDGGRGVGLASDRPNRNSDYTNRISDLNPNDIETYTVLKGPEATALYGSQASSGAIIITTKKAKSNKFALQYDNAFRWSRVTRFPEIYQGYGNGVNGTPGSVFSYFGTKYPENTFLFNNIDIFFKDGWSQTHNLGADFGVKNSIFRVSGSIFDQSGVVPNNTYARYNFRISNTTKIGQKIDITPAFAYTHTKNDKVLRSAGGYLLTLLQWPNQFSITNYDDAQGGKIPIFNANPTNDIDNPFFNVNKNISADETDRYLATLGINIRPTDWLTLSGRFGYDTYKTYGYLLIHPQSSSNSSLANLGSLDNYWRKYRGYNHTITATARKSLGDFNFRLMGGTMWQNYQTDQFAIYGIRLKDAVNTDSSNTDPASRVRLLRNNAGEYNQQIIRQLAYFGEFAVNYKNLIFLNYTHRFESASTLPKINRNYNYPGVGMSMIVSDILPFVKKGDILTYWKLRASLASTARLNTPYSTQSVFVNNFASGGGFSYGFTNANPDLRPERQQTYEIGTEMRFFKNKFGIEATFYNTLNKDQIIENFRLSYGTGFVLNTQNAGSTRNTGVEIVLTAPLVNNRNFGWNMQANFNKMWNKVIPLPPNVSEYYIADTWLYANARAGLVLNGRTTTITANTYLRNNAGQILVNPNNGIPLVDGTFKPVGDRNPDFTLGWSNNLRYKNWRLNILWDLKMGGDIFNGTALFLARIGRHQITADRENSRVIEGVLNDGKQNSATPTPNTISIIPQFNSAYYTTLPEEAFIEKDVNWLRLRDITLSYVCNPRPLKDFRSLKSLEFFITGNDLILLTNYTGADPQVNGNTAGSRGVGGFGFDYGTLAVPISLNFGLRAGF